MEIAVLAQHVLKIKANKDFLRGFLDLLSKSNSIVLLFAQSQQEI